MWHPQDTMLRSHVSPQFHPTRECHGYLSGWITVLHWSSCDRWARLFWWWSTSKCTNTNSCLLRHWGFWPPKSTGNKNSSGTRETAVTNNQRLCTHRAFTSGVSTKPSREPPAQNFRHPQSELQPSPAEQENQGDSSAEVTQPAVRPNSCDVQTEAPEVVVESPTPPKPVTGAPCCCYNLRRNATPRVHQKYFLLQLSK